MAPRLGSMATLFTNALSLATKSFPHPMSDSRKFLKGDPWAFDFYRAMRLLEAAHPDRPRLGESSHPRDDPMRFGQEPSLAFAPSTLAGFEPASESGRPVRLMVYFFGLFGPNGPLPTHMTEYARERRQQAHDPTLTRFMDVFHHRLICLFYRAWADAQKAVDLDRPEDSRFASYLGSFFGMGMSSLRNRDEAPDWTKIFFAGRLAPQARNAEGLEAIILGDFGVPAQVKTFLGQWLKLPEASLCRLGGSPESASLGKTSLVGERFWSGQLKFRIRLGPLDLADYYRLLPTGAAFRRLRAWVLNYSGREYFWEAQLVLKAAQTPTPQLGKAGLLGWTCWLKSKPMTRDPDNLILPGDV
jgi:type VI secretion system protein ImpH